MEELIGLNKISAESTQKTPTVSKFDGLANALEEIESRLAQCNIEIEKL